MTTKKSRVTDENNQVVVLWISSAQHEEEGSVRVISDNYAENIPVHEMGEDHRGTPELGLTLVEVTENTDPIIPLTQTEKYGIC